MGKGSNWEGLYLPRGLEDRASDCEVGAGPLMACEADEKACCSPGDQDPAFGLCAVSFLDTAAGASCAAFCGSGTSPFTLFSAASTFLPLVIRDVLFVSSNDRHL